MRGNTRPLVERARFLCRIVRKEARHLESTTSRLFAGDQTLFPSQVEIWLTDPLLSERLDAFVVRYSRLQDTVVDKLIPALLQLTSESLGPAIDNLNKAEKFGWIDSAEEWMLYRKLRNQMVHEYIEDTAVLTDALRAGRDFVPVLIRLSLNVVEETEGRIQEAGSE